MKFKEFPYKYYFYGSHDSTDEDVVISIPQEDMPTHQEDRKRFVKKLEEDYDLPWNATLVVIEDGVVKDTIYPKSWVDSLNNSIFHTYEYHLSKQVYPNPIEREVNRNKLLAIYKCVRTVLAMHTRTHYRNEIKPITKGCHHFNLKIKALKKINFETIETFNQPNMNDVDVWKVIAFYIGQNLSLIRRGIEIYTKKDLVKHHPLLINFIYRRELNHGDILILNNYLDTFIDMLETYGSYECDDTTMKCESEIINMKNEIFLSYESSI